MFVSSLNLILRIVTGALRRLARPSTPPTTAAPPLQGAAAEAPARSAAVAAPPPQGAAPAGARTRSGKYDPALLELVTARPGITVAQAADDIGIPATGLYPTIRRLQAQGKLTKVGRGLHPSSG